MASTFRRKLAPVRLAKAPLVLALFQVRFSTVLKMEESYLPDIQERLRDDYPVFSEAELQEFVLAPGAPSVQGRRSKRWLFVAADEKSAVVLTPDFVVLETATYSEFESFAEALAKVLKVVKEAAGIQYAERLGLRYVSRIAPGRGEALSQYLNGGLTGISAAVLSDEDAGLRFTPTISTTKIGALTEQGSTLILRVTEKGPKDVSLPPGLEENDLDISIEPVDRHSAVLDIDHFTSERRDFNVSGLVEYAWRLHEYVVLAFRQATTDHARETWGAES